MPAVDLQSDRFEDLGLLFLRLGASLYLAIGHGWPKIAGSVGGNGWMPSVTETVGSGIPALLFVLVAVFLELFGSLLAALGFCMRTISACLVLYLASSYLVGLGLESFELTFLYGSVFLALLLTGPGNYSIDEYLTVEDSPAYVVVNSKEMPAEGS